MRHPEYQYLNLLKLLLENGDERIDRTGVGTRAVFGYEMRFNLEEGFPVLTTKRLFWKTAFKEMLWMLSGWNKHSRAIGTECKNLDCVASREVSERHW